MTLKVEVRGTSHLAQTLRAAARMRGFEISPPFSMQDITFIAQDVLDHADVDKAEPGVCTSKLEFDSYKDRPMLEQVPLVLVSQVPPGTTRRWAGGRPNIYYQVDTIIMKRALARAYAPEQFIVGCADPSAPLPLAYQEYLAAHDCPVLQMSYESAEIAKCAINYMLAKQIEASKELFAAACALHVGGEYAAVEAALRNDARIGPHAYLYPGEPNQHLTRDVDTINRLRGEVRGPSLVELNRKLSDAYVRLRSMIPGALDTPHGPTPEQVWETTENALRALLRTAAKG